MDLRKWLKNKSHIFWKNNVIFTDEIKHNSVIQSQLNIGWFHLLYGIISEKLVCMQQFQYTDVSSRKSSSRWATNVTRKLWNITYQLWLHHSDALHNTKAIHALSGLVPLKWSTTAEYVPGKDNLPSVYSFYFHMPLHNLLSKSAQYLKRLFLLVRSAIEACSITTRLDEFSADSLLRVWVRISTID